MRKLVCLFILLALAGCMDYPRMNKVVDTWKGAHFSELIASWGIPELILDNQQGGNIYVWSSVISPESTSQVAPARSSSPKYGTFWFWTDSDGIIYKWSWRAW
jgi:hypothetical protein